MELKDFGIGTDFLMSGKPWRCVDIGTWSIAAIELDRPDDPSWYNGPPYAVVCHVLDRYDFPDCEPVSLHTKNDPGGTTQL